MKIYYSSCLFFFFLLGGPCLAKTVTVNCDNQKIADFGSVHEALQHLSPAGGVIHIGLGQCTEPLLNIGSNITIVGERAGTVIRSQGVYAVKIWKKENVTIKNLKIIPDVGNVLGIESRATDSLTIENVEIEGTGGVGNGVSIFGGMRITIKNNNIIDANGHGISISDLGANRATNVKIVGNTVRNASMSCINVSHSVRVRVVNNYVENCGSPDFRYGGVRVSNGSEHVIISGNNINNAYRGIFVSGIFNENDQKYTKSINVFGNTIQSATGEGMFIENIENVNIFGNSIEHPVGDAPGILLTARIKGVTITNNNINFHRGWGVAIKPYLVSRAIIQSNYFECNQLGSVLEPRVGSITNKDNLIVGEECRW